MIHGLFPTAFACTRLVLMLSLLALCGFEPTTVTVRDRFHNNALNTTLWEVVDIGSLAVDEANQRLQFSSDGFQGFGHSVVMRTRHWGANWREGFIVEFG